MPVKIRLSRIGAKRRPFYRVVAVDERKKRTGAYLELLGTYNPLTNPKDINLKQDRIDHWIKNGAVLSDGFLRVIGKAPQKPPRKPKKNRGKSEEPTVAAAPVAPSETTEASVETESPEVVDETKAPESPVAETVESETETPVEAPAEPTDENTAVEVSVEEPATTEESSEPTEETNEEPK